MLFLCFWLLCGAVGYCIDYVYTTEKYKHRSMLDHCLLGFISLTLGAFMFALIPMMKREFPDQYK